MPITINECRHCGKLPNLDYDNSNEDFGLYCNCTYPQRNDVIGFTLEQLANGWNGMNPKGE